VEDGLQEPVLAPRGEPLSAPHRQRLGDGGPFLVAGRGEARVRGEHAFDVLQVVRTDGGEKSCGIGCGDDGNGCDHGSFLLARGVTLLARAAHRPEAPAPPWSFRPICATSRRRMLPPMPGELRRLLAVGGFAVWVMVGVPIFLHSGLSPSRLAGWTAAYLVFGASLALALRTRRLLWLLPQSAAVIALVLTLCDGFEGALLVLVALQLGGRTSRRVGLAAVAVQSAALFAAIAVHWNANAALLLAPPYLGFQVLAYFAAEGMWRLADAKELRLENERLAERVRISRELHDRLGHHLTALRLNLEVADRRPDALAAARELGRGLLGEVRAAVEELRDPERLDLGRALRTLAEELVSPRVHVSAPAALALRDPACALAVLRCAQEIATNAARHAGAQNLWIDLAERSGVVELRARDDGRGASDVRVGNGLRGMRERLESAGGTLTVETAEGRGFELRATLPLRAGP